MISRQGRGLQIFKVMAKKRHLLANNDYTAVFND